MTPRSGQGHEISVFSSNRLQCVVYKSQRSPLNLPDYNVKLRPTGTIGAKNKKRFELPMQFWCNNVVKARGPARPLLGQIHLVRITLEISAYRLYCELDVLILAFPKLPLLNKPYKCVPCSFGLTAPSSLRSRSTVRPKLVWLFVLNFF